MAFVAMIVVALILAAVLVTVAASTVHALFHEAHRAHGALSIPWLLRRVVSEAK